MVNIAVLGYGTVGSGVVEVIDTNGAGINQRIGEKLQVKYVLDLKDFPGDGAGEVCSMILKTDSYRMKRLILL